MGPELYINIFNYIQSDKLANDFLLFGSLIYLIVVWNNCASSVTSVVFVVKLCILAIND